MKPKAIKIYFDKDMQPTSKENAVYMKVRQGSKVSFVVLKK